MSMGKFKPTHWGRLKQVNLPHSCLQQGDQQLSPRATAVLAVILDRERRIPPSLASAGPTPIRIGKDYLTSHTGLAKTALAQGIQELSALRYIAREDKRNSGKYGTPEYLLTSPSTGQPLQREGRNRLLRTNYFTLPSCLIQRPDLPGSLAHLTSKEFSLYLAFAYKANTHKRLLFVVKSADLQRLSRLSPKTYKQALSSLEEKGLLWVLGQDGQQLELEMLDPYTGAPLFTPDGDATEDPANYQQGHKRADFVQVSPETVEARLRMLFGTETPLSATGELMVLCCFHTERTPSLAVNVRKRVFRCHGACKRKGHLTELIAQKLGVSKSAAWRIIAEWGGRDVTFHTPDAQAEAVYSYRNTKGVLLKQVLRFRDDAGRKSFKQRTPVAGGWDYEGASKLGPALYNLDRIQPEHVDTVVITEGEQDADNVSKLHLLSKQYGQIVAVTSGHADSWHESLVHQLKGKRVIVMPDADEAGRRYADAVVASLKAEHIAYKLVSFEETGFKDVSEYLAQHNPDDLVRMIGSDWARSMPDDQEIEPVSIAIEPEAI